MKILPVNSRSWWEWHLSHIAGLGLLRLHICVELHMLSAGVNYIYYRPLICYWVRTAYGAYHSFVFLSICWDLFLPVVSANVRIRSLAGPCQLSSIFNNNVLAARREFLDVIKGRKFQIRL